MSCCWDRYRFQQLRFELELEEEEEEEEVEGPAHSVERYDPAANAWEMVVPMATARAFPFALLM